MEINRACPPRPTYRRQAGKLGEIIQIRINYFTCLRQAGGAQRRLFLLYFNRISKRLFQIRFSLSMRVDIP